MDDAVAEWRAQAGAQLETEGHGVADLGWRRGGASVQIFTDTLDLRHAHTGDHGKAEIGLRAAAFAAGMWITPWSHGAPDDARKQIASYVGPDASVQRWLGHGLYAGVGGSVRWLAFRPMADATLAVDDTGWLRAEGTFGGWWSDRRHVRVDGGIDLTSTGGLSPHVAGSGRLAADGPLAPFGELHAGAAANADDIVATRLGGLVPYTVPLAGAAWAEFWVEDYATVRAGLAGTIRFATLSAFADVGAWTFPAATTLPSPPDQQGAIGLGAALRLASDGWFADAAVGHAPGLPRRDGASPLSVYVLAGTDWRPLRR